MSDSGENISGTPEFDRELALVRLQGFLELINEKFVILGEQLKVLNETMEKLKDQ